MNILLTGGGSGIGAEVIKRVAAGKDVQIVYTYRKSKRDDFPGNVRGIKCNLSNAAQVKKLIREIKDTEFDVLVNNAFEKPAWEQFYKAKWDDIQKSIDTGVHAAFELTQEVTRAMKKKKKGLVINILSSIVLDETPGQMSAYVIAKYAMLGLHNVMVAELTKSGIRVNAISPFMVETQFLSELPDHYVEMTKETMPGKKLINPARVAEVVEYLLSDESLSLNGMNLPVYGEEAR